MKLLLFLLLPMFSLSQEIVTTSSGKKVRLNANGTWEYVQSTKKENIEFKCEDVIQTTVDKVTGKSTTATKDFINIGEKEKGFDVIMLTASNLLVFSIGVNGKIGCIDEKDKMNVLFRDGTKLELVHNSKFNCSGDFTVYFSKSFGTLDDLELFKTKEIETMRVWGSSNFVEKDLTQEESKKLLKAFECLSEKM